MKQLLCPESEKTILGRSNSGHRLERGSWLRWSLLVLAFFSGACGIAYEVLYSRLLGTYLGHIYYVSGSILSCYLLMLGVGSFVAHRWRSQLWLIELMLGAYAAMLAVAIPAWQSQVIAYISPLAASPLRIIFWIFAVLALPAGLSGFSVPLFSLVLEDLEHTPSPAGAFRWIYFLYNFGAAVFVLIIEFYLLRRWGMQASLLSMSCLNFGTGLMLWRIQRAGDVADGLLLRASDTKDGISESGQAIFLLAILSGVFQLLMLRIATAVFGPFQENFALMVALTLAGIAVGTAAVQVFDLQFGGFLFLGSVAVSLPFFLLRPAIHLWALGSLVAGEGRLGHLMLRVLVLSLIGGPGLLFFGATIPAAVRRMEGSAGRVGRLLGIASLGNVAGYLLTMLWWSDWLGDCGLAVLVCAGVALVSGWTAATGLRTWTIRCAPAIIGLALVLCWPWPSKLLNLGYASLRDPRTLRSAASNVQSIDQYRKYGHNVGVVHHPDGAETLVIEGYCSLLVTPEKGPNLAEFLVGVAPSFFAQNRSEGLVLGVGTGITAGAALHFLEHVDAVEINPAILEMLPRYAEINNHVATHPRARIMMQDALTTLATAGKKYGVIINTVTSPLYFSSAKLYTKDFFDIVKHRLAPAGVYAFWFDARVGETGARIILNTMKNSFSHFGFLLLRSGYVLVLCSESPLVFHRATPVQCEAEFNAALRRTDIPLTVTELIEALSFTRHGVAKCHWSEPPNTFDRPVLEFEMAKLDTGSPKLDLEALLGIDLLEDGLDAGVLLEDAAFRKRILALQHDMDAWSFRLFYQRYRKFNVPEDFFRQYGGYLFKTASTSGEICAHATSLVGGDHLETALELLDHFARFDPARASARTEPRELEYAGWLRLVAYRGLDQVIPPQELHEYSTRLIRSLLPTATGTLQKDLTLAIRSIEKAVQNSFEAAQTEFAAINSERLIATDESVEFSLTGLGDALSLAVDPSRCSHSIRARVFRFPERIFYRRLLLSCGPNEPAIQQQMAAALAPWGAGDYESRALLRLCWLLGLTGPSVQQHLESKYPL